MAKCLKFDAKKVPSVYLNTSELRKAEPATLVPSGRRLIVVGILKVCSLKSNRFAFSETGFVSDPINFVHGFSPMISESETDKNLAYTSIVVPGGRYAVKNTFKSSASKLSARDTTLVIY